jgi:hypothetical protein
MAVVFFEPQFGRAEIDLERDEAQSQVRPPICGYPLAHWRGQTSFHYEKRRAKQATSCEVRVFLLLVEGQADD